MSPKEKIAKLEGLLARVKERAEAPRANGAAAFSPPASRTVQPGALAAAPQTVPPPASELTAYQSPTAPPPRANGSTRPAIGSIVPPAIISIPPVPETSGWSDPPPPTSADPDVEARELDSDAEVEISAEVVEVDIDIDEPGAFVPAESGAQPIAEQVAEVEPEPEPEELPEQLLATTTSVPAAVAEPSLPPANELVEPEPSSSPRPIATEAAEAYEAAGGEEDESAPRHTPPPESGKQVAAPSVKPEPPRKTSVPPASLDGHTLLGVSAPSALGGWREPGMPIPREIEPARGPAVRVPPPPPPPPPPPEAAVSSKSVAPPKSVSVAPPPPVASPSVPPAPLSPRVLEAVSFGPEITRAELPGDAQVAMIEGIAPSFAPATFGELLDATLSL